MSDEGRFQRVVSGLQLRVWLTGIIAFVTGIVLSVAWFGSGRLKISWTLSGSDIIALATLGGILVTAIATVALAASTRGLATSTDEQLRLARQEFQAAQRAGRPELLGSATFPSSRASSTEVLVEQIHGSEPAYDVSVLVRWRHDGLVQTAVARCGTLAPAHATFKKTLTAANGWMWRGKEPPVQVAEDDYWLGLTWTRTDGTLIKIGETVERGESVPKRKKPPGLRSGPSSVG